MITLAKKINWWFVVSIITFACCLKYRLDDQCYYNYYLLPLFFSFLTLLISKETIYFSKVPGLTLFMVIAVARYCILPYYCSQTIKPLNLIQDYGYIDEAIYLMLYEMVAAFAYIKYLYRKIPTISAQKIREVRFYPHRIVFTICLLWFLLFTITNRAYLFRGFSLITEGVVSEDFSNYGLSTILFLGWNTITLWLYAYIIMRIAQGKRLKKLKLAVAIALTLFLIILTYTSQSTISRWYTIICTISGYYLLRKCFPSYLKSINLFIIAPLVLLIIIATAYKNFGNQQDISNVVVSSFLNVYLAGPTSVNAGISLNHTVDVGIVNLGVDVLNNMPIVNHYIDRELSTAYLYNNHLGRIWGPDSQGDQIIPLISQGQAYFGLLLSPLLTLIFIYVIWYFDKKYLYSDGYHAFLYAFIACWCALTPVLNMTINISWWWIRILPLMLFITLMRMYETRRTA